MDEQTSNFYARYADELTDTSEARQSAMLPHIERAVRVGATVLDVGAGSGRDMAAMLTLGLNAFGAEPNEAMRRKAISLYPSLQGRLCHATLPALGRPFSDRAPAGFDAVVCSAVLMHLDSTELPVALASMMSQLRSTAVGDDAVGTPALLVSLPRMDSSRLVNDRDEDGRRFFNHDPEELRHHLLALDMSLERSVVSDAVRMSADTVWCTMVFRRSR